MLTRVYLTLSTLAIGLYGLATVRGWEFVSYGKETVQQSTARHQSGGHRSLWISSFRGGK